MNTQATFTANVSILITAPMTAVWDALTNPEKIRAYFFGTEAVSDWKVGSPLLFKGVWEGTAYLDKGTILQSEFPHLFQYNYISSMSGLEDKPEHYATITYQLTEEAGGTSLCVTQDNINSEERKTHSEQNWAYVLGELKKLVEAGS